MGDADREIPRDQQSQQSQEDLDASRDLEVADVDPRAMPQTRRVEDRLFVQEIARSGLAVAGVVLLFVVVIAAFVRATTWEETRTVLDLFVPVITALIGAIAGYYFADKGKRDRS